MSTNVTAFNVVLRTTGVNSSVALKAPVRCATTGPITLSGLQTIDGVTFQASDVAFPNTGTNRRVLVKNQIDLTQNGIYDVNTAAWTRSADFDGNDDAVQGTRVQVAQGNVNQGLWLLLTPDPVYLTNSGSGVSSITWAPQNLVITAIGTISSVAGVSQVIGTPGSVNQVVTSRAYAVEGDGGGGTFVWSTANHATDVANDPQHGVFVPPSADLTGASGAWIRQYSGNINAAWFGGLTKSLSDTTTKTNNSATLQAAIDWAYNSAVTTIVVQVGVYYFNPSIYLDAPGNLRSNPASPTIFSFSLELRGDGGIGNHEGAGTQLHFTDNTAPALIVGTGQGMKVSSLSVLGPAGATSRAALNSGGVGIALAGGNAGLSRVVLENVMIENFYRGVQSGYNRDTLCDSATLRKCFVANCFIGWDISQTQNYIDRLDDCVFQSCTKHVYSNRGKAVTITGGNYSTTNAGSKRLTISGTSALTSFTDNVQGGSFTNWTFTTTLSASNQLMTDGAFDSFCLSTVGFGLIPLQLTNYNSGTLVATLKFLPAWLNSHYFSIDMKNNTDITTEIQAATILYAAERIYMFTGCGIHATGVHIENPASLTTLADVSGITTGDRVARIDSAFFNYNLDQHEYNVGGADSLALFYCQQVFPFVRPLQASCVLSDCAFNGVNCTQGVNVEVTAQRLISRNCDLPTPNVVVPFQFKIYPDDAVSWQSMGHGAGEWDSTPFLPKAGGATRFYAWDAINGVPFRGWHPSPSATPRLTPSQYTSISGGPGSLGSYPTLHGEAIYSVVEYNSSGLAHIFARSAHTFFSYGQNLTINWSYKGQTNVVTLSDTTRMFPGLKISLDNGGGSVAYIVTGVYPALGYITVMNIGTPTHLLAGTKTVTYTGATVLQESYSLTQY